MRLKHFRTLWEFAYPKAKILITGRPNFFLDDNELKAALGISNPVANSPYCEAIRLTTFDKDQIRVALRNHDHTVRNQIIQLITDKPDSRLAELVSRPSLLHIVSTLWTRERLFEKVEQLNSAFVMDLFVRHSYTRQGLKETSSPEFMALTTNERQYFMSGIAASMSSEGSNQITTTQLSEIIRKLIEYIPDSISKESETIGNETKIPLRDRIKQSEFAEEHIKTDVRTCGLLVDDPTVVNSFRFGHKSFMEFLFAKVVASQLIKKNSATTAIMLATNSSVESILRLPTSIEFLNDLALTELQSKGENLKSLSPEKYLSLLFLYHISKKRIVSLLLIKYSVYLVEMVGNILKLEKRAFFKTMLEKQSKLDERDLETSIKFIFTQYILILFISLIMITTFIFIAKGSIFDTVVGRNARLVLVFSFLTMVGFFLFSFIPTSRWIRLCKKIGLSNKEILENLSNVFNFRK